LIVVCELDFAGYYRVEPAFDDFPDTWFSLAAILGFGKNQTDLGKPRELCGLILLLNFLDSLLQST
jgi:hypothetical protein